MSSLGIIFPDQLSENNLVCKRAIYRNRSLHGTILNDDTN